jgi:drug/metabolite transporter (DMT)-like permease
MGDWTVGHRWLPSSSTTRVFEGGGPRSRWIIWLALVAISVSWGTMGIATQAALREGIAPYSLTALRMTLASAILLGYLVATKRRVRVSRHFLGDGLVMALGQVVLPSVLFAAALERLPAGAVSLMFALVPAATALWVRLLIPATFLGRRATLGLGMALTGGVLVALNCTPGDPSPSGQDVGVGLMAAAVLVASFHGVYAKRHSTHPLFEVMAPQILIGTMVLLAPGILGGAMDLQGLSLLTWGVIAYLAVGVTVVPTAMMWWLFKRSSALKVALINYLFPIVAIVVGVLWFGERLSGGLALGGIVLLAGVAVVETGNKVLHQDHGGLRPCPDLGVVPVERPAADGLAPTDGEAQRGSLATLSTLSTVFRSPFSTVFKNS